MPSNMLAPVRGQVEPSCTAPEGSGASAPPPPDDSGSARKKRSSTFSAATEHGGPPAASVGCGPEGGHCCHRPDNFLDLYAGSVLPVDLVDAKYNFSTKQCE